MFDFFLQSAAQALGQPVVIAVITAVILVLVFALWLARPDPIIPGFATANGRVDISRKALHELIEGRVLAFKAVGHARAEVRARSGMLHTRLTIRVRPNVQLEELSGQIQAEITGLLKDNLGLENTGDVDVVVVGIAD